MSRITKSLWGCKDGRDIFLFTFTNQKGMEVKIDNYGGAIVSICVPDREGRRGDVVLGLAAADDYLNRNFTFFGAIVGRCMGRIDQGQMTIDGKDYQLPVHHKIGCHYNGGDVGFSRRVWEPQISVCEDGNCLYLSYFSPDGEEGYPGNVKVTVRYNLSEDNALKIRYFAVSDAPTPVNLSNQIYFNLSGHWTGSIKNHLLKLYASRFTPIRERVIPTGEVHNVVGSHMDFSEFHTLGERLENMDEQMALGLGYDHNWVLDGSSPSLKKAAELYAPDTGRLLEIFTSMPGIHLYTANVMNLPSVNIPNTKDRAAYRKFCGACLMPQYFPDAVNHPGFPSPILRPGRTYDHTSVYRFSVRT